MDLDIIHEFKDKLRDQIGRVIIGQETAVDLMLVSLLTEGHILLEGPPGTAKTLLAQTFARSLSLKFGRIQFTPDLMPGDVIGTNLFDFQTNKFSLTKGPIFTDLLLADEINRTPPKTQSALLQAMGERVVTIDGKTHDLGQGFMVIATQNPIEQQGTYPLPEAQLDRFLFKHILDYPSRTEELKIVALHGHRTTIPDLNKMGLEAITGLEMLLRIREFISGIHLTNEIVTYVVDVIRETRKNPSLQYGGSPRAANMLTSAARAYAVLNGRDYVIPDDVKYLAKPALRHRVVLSPGAEIEGLKSDQIIDQILEQVEAPR
jgi:MoxR-like ATPase